MVGTQRVRSWRVVVACVGVALIAAACGSKDVAQPTRTIPGTTAPPKVCVAAKDIPPKEGKPTVSIPEGPAPTELQTTDIKVGEGPEVKAGDKLSVQYVGVACSTGKQFDASWDSGKPLDLTLGQGDVISGWDKGLVGMKLGGQRRLVIPASLAYGAKGKGKDIGPNEPLIFYVDLVEVTQGAGGAPGAAGAGAPGASAVPPGADSAPTVVVPTSLPSSPSTAVPTSKPA